jgi:hypothetical protein
MHSGLKRWAGAASLFVFSPVNRSIEGFVNQRTRTA